MHSLTSGLQDILDVVPDALVGMDNAGMIRFVNRQTEALFGYEPHDLIGQPVEVLVPSSLRSIHKVHREDFIATPGTRQMGVGPRLSGQRRDGTTFQVQVALSHVDTEDGLLVLAAVRKAVASVPPTPVAGAHQSPEPARSMIESSLDSLVAISPEGKITDVNEATVRVTGVPRAKLIGTDFSEYFTDPEKANRIYQLVFTEGMAVDYPLTMRHRDGTLTEVLYNASVHRDASGRELGVFAAARDVTKQVQAQRKIAEQHAKEQMHTAELEHFQQMTIDRALKVIELKKEIEYLKRSGSSSAGERGESDDQW
jgi:PAS domain S-box-containing protein